MAGLRKIVAGLLVVSGLLLAVVGQLLPAGPGMTQPGWLRGLVGLWLPMVVAGALLYVVGREQLGRVVDDGGGVLDGSTSGPFDRWEIIEATNWKRMNALVLRRSLGVAAIVAGMVALIVSLGLVGAGNQASAVPAFIWLLTVLVGFVLVLTSRRSSDQVRVDYTHRVCVRVPDLFSLHSFHVHLRQIAEDQGYVVTDETSPGRGGSQARFDDEVYLTEGGFRARKRPIEPSISVLPDDSPYADLVSLTTGSLTMAMVGASLLVTGQSVIGLLLVVFGLVAFVYDYIRRTRQWAELYCVQEGTVYTPTANVYDGDLPDEGIARREPTISAAESSTDLVVTLGAKHSIYFENDRLVEDFETLVGRLDDVASENSYTIVDEQTRERTVTRAQNGQ